MPRAFACLRHGYSTAAGVIHASPMLGCHERQTRLAMSIGDCYVAEIRAERLLGCRRRERMAHYASSPMPGVRWRAYDTRLSPYFPPPNNTWRSSLLSTPLYYRYVHIIARACRHERSQLVYVILPPCSRDMKICPYSSDAMLPNHAGR